MPAAGYSGRADPGWLGSFDDRKPVFSTRMPAPSRRDDQAALSAKLYVPLWRIGFLVPPRAFRADGTVRMSDSVQKIKTQRAIARDRREFVGQ